MLKYPYHHSIPPRLFPKSPWSARVKGVFFMKIEMNVDICDFPVVDMHLHLPVAQDDWLAPWRERYIAQNGRERYEELIALGKTAPGWLGEFCFPAPEAPMEDPMEAGERWYQECERFALERVVFMTGGW